MIEICSQVLGRKAPYLTLPRWVFAIGSRFNPAMKEASELLPRYARDNAFSSAKFAEHFPDFRVTTYREGITELMKS